MTQQQQQIEDELARLRARIEAMEKAYEAQLSGYRKVMEDLHKLDDFNGYEQ